MATSKKKTPAVQSNEIMNPYQLMQMALSNGSSVENLEKLMALEERYNNNKARMDFYEAKAEFQSECPTIKKVKNADYGTTNSNKQGAKFAFAPLGFIAEQIKPLLVKFGFSYRWEFGYNQETKNLLVTCLVTHKSGHTERTTAEAPPENQNKNVVQANGSTYSYLERYSLIAAFGLTIAGEDIDGLLLKNMENDDELVTDEQIKEIDEIIKKSSDKKEFREKFRKDLLQWAVGKENEPPSDVPELTKTQYVKIITQFKDKKEQAA